MLIFQKIFKQDVKSRPWIYLMPLKRSGVGRDSVSQHALLDSSEWFWVHSNLSIYHGIEGFVFRGEGHQNLGAMTLTGAGAAV